jgi:4-amino-4-deoxy-L-arabinose transferase-like glycosyltransferase
MVNAQNLMTDVPAVAFSLCSLAIFIFSVEHERTSYALLAGVLGGLAALTRYPGLATPLLLVVYSIMTGKGLRLSILAGLASMVVFGIWLIENFAIYSTPHVWASYKFYKSFYAYHSFGPTDILIKAVSNFSAIMDA